MKASSLLPFDKFTIITSLSLKEVQQRFAETIQPTRSFSFSFSPAATKPYEGTVDENHFTFQRILNYRNSFTPIIYARVGDSLGKTQVSIRMRPSTAVLIFIGIWLGIVGTVCITILVAAIIQFREIANHGISLLVFIPFLMFGFGYAIMLFGYRWESKKSRQFLLQLLEADVGNKEK